LNLQKDPAESYDACPYCLTEIVVEEEPAPLYTEPEPLEQEDITEPEEAETEIEEPAHMEEPVKPPETPAEAPSECLHHLGYLSERSSKEQIPDECMMCKDIVTCMLKKMKG
jgi:hypothetical protein